MLILWLPPCLVDRMQHSRPWECKWEPANNYEFVIVVACLGHHGSCAILLLCYIKVFHFMRKRSRIATSKTENRLRIQNEMSTYTHNRQPTHSMDPAHKGGVQFLSLPGSTMITSIADIPPSRGVNDACAAALPSVEDYSGAYGPKPDKSATSVIPSTSSTTPDVKGQVNTIEHINTNYGNANKQVRGVERKERRAFKTLTYIIVGYLICWVPFHIVFDISAVNPEAVPEIVFTITFWLTYINSTINPLLYNFSNPEFRVAFRKILCIK
jgi:hypothetical protein